MLFDVDTEDLGSPARRGGRSDGNGLIKGPFLFIPDRSDTDGNKQ